MERKTAWKGMHENILSTSEWKHVALLHLVIFVISNLFFANENINASE